MSSQCRVGPTIGPQKGQGRPLPWGRQRAQPCPSPRSRLLQNRGERMSVVSSLPGWVLQCSDHRTLTASIWPWTLPFLGGSPASEAVSEIGRLQVGRVPGTKLEVPVKVLPPPELPWMLNASLHLHELLPGESSGNFPHLILSMLEKINKQELTFLPSSQP